METHDPNVFSTILGGVSRGFWTQFLDLGALSAIFWHLKTGTFGKIPRPLPTYPQKVRPLSLIPETCKAWSTKEIEWLKVRHLPLLLKPLPSNPQEMKPLSSPCLISLKQTKGNWPPLPPPQTLQEVADAPTQLIRILDFYMLTTYKYRRHSRAICPPRGVRKATPKRGVQATWLIMAIFWDRNLTHQ